MGRKRKLDDAELSGLRKVLHTGGISMQGLEQLLKALRDAGIHDASSVDIRRANAVEFEHVRYFLPMPLITGGTWDWEFADPCKLLQVALERSQTLQPLFSHAASGRKPTRDNPWNLVVGLDEFMPGIQMTGRAAQYKLIAPTTQLI